MSEILPFVYLEQAKREDVQTALGGRVWWSDDSAFIFWNPEGHDVTVMIPYQQVDTGFDASLFIERARAAWETHGVRL